MRDNLLILNIILSYPAKIILNDHCSESDNSHIYNPFKDRYSEYPSHYSGLNYSKFKKGIHS